jgi:cytochrome P450
MPGNIKKRQDQIREIAHKAVTRLRAMQGKGDFVTNVSLEFPLEVIMNILGVPEEDFPFMLRITQEIFGPLDPDTKKAMAKMSADEITKIQRATTNELVTYFNRITEVEGLPISEAAINGYYMVIATAGHDTTSSTTSIAMWALATQTGLLQRIKAALSLIPAFIDECIRWATPVKHFMHSAAEDTEVSGQKIKKGDWLMLCYASVNRDEDIFENPSEFNIDRSPNKHIAFGCGAHLCLGQHLAKMEIRILLEEILPRLKSVKLAGQPRMVESFFANGLKNLPIEFEMEA